MRKTLALAALAALLAAPAFAQAPVRSFCNNQLEVQAMAGPASGAQGNYVRYYASVHGKGDALTRRTATIAFAPPAPVQAGLPQRVSLAEGTRRVQLGTERRADGGTTPSIPRDRIGNYVTVTCE